MIYDRLWEIAFCFVKAFFGGTILIPSFYDEFQLQDVLWKKPLVHIWWKGTQYDPIIMGVENTFITDTLLLKILLFN